MKLEATERRRAAGPEAAEFLMPAITNHGASRTRGILAIKGLAAEVLLALPADRRLMIEYACPEDGFQVGSTRACALGKNSGFEP